MSFIEKTTGYVLKWLQSGSQEEARKTNKTNCSILNAWAVVLNSSYLLSI